MRILLLVVLYVVLRRFCMAKSTRARSSARLERTPDKREVGSSSLPGLCLTWGISSAGRAPALQAGGQRFDPAMLHQKQALSATLICGR